MKLKQEQEISDLFYEKLDYLSCSNYRFNKEIQQG